MNPAKQLTGDPILWQSKTILWAMDSMRNKMNLYYELKTGDRVLHRSRGPGVVTIVNSEVLVTFDAAPRTPHGNKRGLYDKDWFRICGHLLSKI